MGIKLRSLLVSCQLLYDQKGHLMSPIRDCSGHWDTDSILSAPRFLKKITRICSLLWETATPLTFAACSVQSSRRLAGLELRGMPSVASTLQMRMLKPGLRHLFQVRGLVNGSEPGPFAWLPPPNTVSLCLLITRVEKEISGAHEMGILHGREGSGDSESPTRNPEEKT